MNEFFAMGGYGAYVWTSYGVTGLFLLLLFVWSWFGARARETELEQVRKLSRAERRAPASATMQEPEGRRLRRYSPCRQRRCEQVALCSFVKQQRMILVAVAVLLLGGATALVMTALSDSVAFFATPSDIAEGKVDKEQEFSHRRPGGRWQREPRVTTASSPSR